MDGTESHAPKARKRYCPKCGYVVSADARTCPNYPRGRLGGLCAADLTGVEPRLETEADRHLRGETHSLPRLAIRMTLGALILAVLALALGIAFEQVERWRVVRVHPPPGLMWDVQGERLHLYCTGEGSPTVVLESGSGSGSFIWTAVQLAIAETTRVCSYDRAGLGWSGKRNGTHGAVPIAEQLHELLRAASIEPPYVMVGHSLGGPRTLIYDRLFPGEVAGFVLVDSTDPDWLERLPDEAAALVEAQQWRPSMRYSLMAESGVLRLLNAGAGKGPHTEFIKMASAFAPQSLPEALREMSAAEQTLEEAQKSHSLGRRPIVVLTAGQWRVTHNGGVTPDLSRQMRDLRTELQRELAARSTNSDHRVVAEAEHLIQLDAPQAVITAVEDVVTSVRTCTAVREGHNR
jgi:pimeloyl-ACP methyl ester carboxylesterase